MRAPSSSSESLVANHVAVASYDSYAEAQEAVDYLSDQGFPVKGTLIVGAGLRLIERVLGRLNYLRAAGMGAASGAWFGLLIGLFFGIFAPGPVSTILTILWGLIWGIIAGAVFGLVAHALTGGRRDFFSVNSLVADRYEVLVETPRAASASELLARHRG